jgi:hypothetical protein
MKNSGLSRIIANLVNKRFPLTERKLELQEALDLLKSAGETTRGNFCYNGNIYVNIKRISVRDLGDTVAKVFKKDDDAFSLEIRHDAYGGRTEKHYLDFFHSFAEQTSGKRVLISRTSIDFVTNQKLLPNEGYFENR